MIRRNRIIGGRRFWRIGLCLLSGLCLAIAIAVVRLPAMAQITQAEITEILDGTEVTIDSQPAKINDIARSGQQVRTGNSRVALVFDNGAAVRLGPNSSLKIGQCLELQQGQGAFAGPANGCTSAVVAGVQGTIYILEQEQEGSQEGSQGIKVIDIEQEIEKKIEQEGSQGIKVIEGEVALAERDNPEGSEAVSIKQGEKVAIVNDRVGEVESLQPWEFGDVLTGILFKGFLGQLPGQEKLQGVCKDLFPNFACPNVGGGGIKLPF
ncbi:MAG: FecR domain-containing protein [Oscillatoria sp. SIO1A7]|nr:FecR domain-containing protein [Oscillatoria sp. SIO1A7]